MKPRYEIHVRGRLVALLRVDYDRDMCDDYALLETIWTDRHHRGHGHARELMRQAIEDADRLGVELHLYPAPSADCPMGLGQLRAWYASLGFEPTGAGRMRRKPVNPDRLAFSSAKLLGVRKRQEAKMGIHPIAALDARGMSQHDALMGALHEPDQMVVNGGEPGNADARYLSEACRALLFTCSYCQQALPYTAYTRDSAGCGELCELCYDFAGEENSNADGMTSDADFEKIEATYETRLGVRAKLAEIAREGLGA